MGNSASVNNFNSKLSKFDNIDISKSMPKFSNRCSACSVQVNLISLKKRKCGNCIEYYCSECMKQYKENVYLCYRCTVFISSNFNWEKLMTLKTKDLKWYLDRQKVDCGNYKEKEQLVELILERFSSDEAHRNRERYRKDLLQKVEVNLDSEVGQMVQEEMVVDQPCTSSSVNPSAGTVIQTEEESNPPPPTYAEVVSIEDMEADEGTENATPEPEHTGQDGGTGRVLIEHIGCHADIEDMSVRQLKDMLAFNRVDYRGCLERHELISRVQRLWAAYCNDRCCGPDGDDASMDPGFVSTPPGGLGHARECVICMDQPIDCVLLECGHMISCVSCASKLAECPICRQNVVRCLRVFAAH